VRAQDGMRRNSLPASRDNIERTSMTQNAVNVFFQVVVLLFAISFHESAHAWMAYRLGDPTAKMLGRITLNPIKHLDLIGSVIMPLISILSGFGVFGWAKPTPVNSRHFRHPVRDDILTSLAGPVSNLILATGAVIGLAVLLRIFSHAPVVEPLALMLYAALRVNVVLAIFNLIPLPPLDGSHVLRHLLPRSLQHGYDMLGMFSIILIFLFAGRVLQVFMGPVLAVFERLLGILV
jgi:Zn-dependent protease